MKFSTSILALALLLSTTASATDVNVKTNRLRKLGNDESNTEGSNGGGNIRGSNNDGDNTQVINNQGTNDGDVNNGSGTYGFGSNGPPPTLRCGTDPNDISANDLGIRFNKITFADDQPVSPDDTGTLHLIPEDFPICPDTATWLRQSQAVSVIQRFDCDECDIPLPILIDAIGGYPTHPSTSGTAYWEELREVVQVRDSRLGNEDPSNLMKLPDIWSSYDIAAVADAVHDEFPGSHHVELIKQLLGESASIDREVLPSYSTADFVRGVVALSDLNTWAIATVAPHNFQVKWAAGRARPEEVVWWISETDTIELTNKGVPDDLVTTIKAMDLADATSFTAYDEGSPKHPSWPAMHSAASVSSLWLSAVMDLSEAQKCEVMAVDYAVAYARTVAGVHFPQDNIAGLNLGQEILARKLPGYLAARYGSDPQAVRAKITTLRLDWNGYLSGPCFKAIAD